MRQIKERIFEGPTINTVSVGFDRPLFDRGLTIAYAYGKPHISCSIKSKDLFINEVIKDCKKHNWWYDRQELETSYKGILIEINDTLPYGEFLMIVPNGDIIVKYKVLMGD
jgi:hypothetical protein